MSQTTSSVALVGGTGLVGTQILHTLLTLPSAPITHALTRRPLPTTSTTPSTALNPMLEPNTTLWPEKIRDLVPTASAFISALGTTRAQAGSVEAQRKIDYDLNLSLMKAAKEGGIGTCVLISSTGTSAGSRMPYSKMKGELEQAAKELGFPHLVILRPGLLVGERQDTRVAEAVLRKIATGLGGINHSLTDFWAQDVKVIGRAAVSAMGQCVEGKRAEGVWVMEQAEIVKLGRTEWKEEKN